MTICRQRPDIPFRFFRPYAPRLLVARAICMVSVYIAGGISSSKDNFILFTWAVSDSGTVFLAHRDLSPGKVFLEA